MPQRTLLLLLLSVLLGMPAEAASIKARQDPDADFSSYRTYAWRDQDPAPNIGSDVRRATEQVLTGKGFERVDPGDDPDLWLEYNAGSADLLRSGWILTIGWYAELWAVPGARSRVEAGLAIIALENGRGEVEDKAVWGGRVLMAGNNPDALMVMAGRAGKETRKLMKKFPSRF